MYPIVISPPKIAGIGHEEQAIAKFLPINFLKSLFWEEQFDLRARDVSKCAGFRDVIDLDHRAFAQIPMGLYVSKIEHCCSEKFWIGPHRRFRLIWISHPREICEDQDFLYR